MKVADVMQKNVESIDVDAKVKDVCVLIFGRGINGVPVIKGKKLVGFVTDRDILQKFYPSMQEYMEDPLRASDFEEREHQVADILSLSVKDIMSRNPITTTADTPILEAQSLMFVKRVGRLPVIDKSNQLVGIIARGDIFRAIVGKKLPLDSEEGFYDRLAGHYDSMYDWEKRLSQEIPELVKFFKKEKVQKVLDVASSTAQHTIALTKKGFETVGIEASTLMHKHAIEKREKLPESEKINLHLLAGVYEEILTTVQSDFDAAIFLGNALPYVMQTDRHILHDVTKILKTKSVVVFQIINFHKIMNRQDGLRVFSIRDCLYTDKKHAYVGFYTKLTNTEYVYNLSVFDLESKKWTFDGISSTPVIYIGEKEIIAILKKLGFPNIKLYGGMFDGPLFGQKFDKEKSDWLNIVAKR